jgi:ABC-2 type transport system ATP-binding protein
MKQKVGIVAAFMHDPDILILDEPTSGLDPLMQQRFIELVSEEKKRGRTILMSSHLFDEIERTCDRVGIIKDGRLLVVEDVRRMRTMRRKVFDITFKAREDVEAVMQSGLEVVREDGLTLEIAIQGDFERLIALLAGRGIANLDIHVQRLEDIFMLYYDKKGAIS